MISTITVDGSELSYKTDNESTCNGSGLRGVVVTTYDTLVEKFGLPYLIDINDHTVSDGKVSAEWVIEFMDVNTYKLTYATIYDWKQYEMGTPFGQYDWHIGGYSIDAVNYVKAVVEGV